MCEIRYLRLQFCSWTIKTRVYACNQVSNLAPDCHLLHKEGSSQRRREIRAAFTWVVWERHHGWNYGEESFS